MPTKRKNVQYHKPLQNKKENTSQRKVLKIKTNPAVRPSFTCEYLASHEICSKKTAIGNRKYAEDRICENMLDGKQLDWESSKAFLLSLRQKEVRHRFQNILIYSYIQVIPILATFINKCNLYLQLIFIEKQSHPPKAIGATSNNLIALFVHRILKLGRPQYDSGVQVSNYLHVFLITFEHELVHAIMNCKCKNLMKATFHKRKKLFRRCTWKNECESKSGHSRVFMSILYNLFKHKTYTSDISIHPDSINPTVHAYDTSLFSRRTTDLRGASFQYNGKCYIIEQNNPLKATSNKASRVLVIRQDSKTKKFDEVIYLFPIQYFRYKKILKPTTKTLEIMNRQLARQCKALVKYKCIEKMRFGTKIELNGYWPLRFLQFLPMFDGIQAQELYGQRRIFDAPFTLIEKIRIL